ncbi:MAG TPA: type IV toxin-antitoxin system AbiEi family antitoxin domain-containing protein [Nocardioides sp.]|nr:type IV toxin-antitoxin system AbiEi family antitoxin domain-containing protein [Nocardioides sp.]
MVPGEERHRQLANRFACQGGLVTRQQLGELGFAEHDIARMLRRRDLVRVHPGVYVGHTGPLSWHQRSWAAVLACWPAGLRGASALRSAQPRLRDGADDRQPIEVVVDWRRTVRVPGVDVRRSRSFPAGVLWTTFPPRQRAEEYVLDLAAAAGTDVDAVGVVADALGAWRASATALRSALDGRARIARRAFLEAVIDDAAAGTCSALEHGYLHRVERAHGLPTPDRQVRESAKGTLYRDVVYAAFGLIVELDGRLHHSGIRNRDRDLERDLDAAVAGRETVRLGWGQVFGGQCRTAPRLGALLRQRGWTGATHPCPECA